MAVERTEMEAAARPRHRRRRTHSMDFKASGVAAESLLCKRVRMQMSRPERKKNHQKNSSEAPSTTTTTTTTTTTIASSAQWLHRRVVEMENPVKKNSVNLRPGRALGTVRWHTHSRRAGEKEIENEKYKKNWQHNNNNNNSNNNNNNSNSNKTKKTPTRLPGMARTREKTKRKLSFFKNKIPTEIEKENLPSPRLDPRFPPSVRAFIPQQMFLR